MIAAHSRPDIIYDEVLGRTTDISVKTGRFYRLSPELESSLDTTDFENVFVRFVRLRAAPASSKSRDFYDNIKGKMPT